MLRTLERQFAHVSATTLGLMAAPVCAGLLAALLFEAAWPGLAVGMTGGAHVLLLRCAPLIGLLIAPLVGLAIVAALPLHERYQVAVATVIGFLIVGARVAMIEALRLAPFLDAAGGDPFKLLPYVDRFTVGGGAAGFLITGLAMRLASGATGGIRRARRSALGDADWMGMVDAQKLFPADGEIVIGERARVDRSRVKALPFDPADRSTWGQGGKAPLLTYKLNFDSTHMLFFAGSGGFKTTSVVVPTALRYRGPLVCLDPANEVAPMVAAHRMRMHRKVRILDPRHPARVGFNVLDWIETSSHKEEDIVAVAQMLLADSARTESGAGAYFQAQAHNLLTGLLAHVLLDPAYEARRNLRSLRAIVSLPEPDVLALIREIQSTSASRFIRETLGVFAHMTEQTFSGVYSTAAKDTQWLSLDAYADMVCGETFASADIAAGDTDVFLNIPAAMLRAYPGIGRVIIGSLVHAMIQADGAHKARAVFCLDEVDLLGTMRVLEDVRDRGRKYGVTLMLFYQSVGQLERHFGRDGATSWFEGAAFVSYAAVKSLETARDVSAKCGEYTVEMKGTSRTLGFGAPASARGTETLTAQRRPLILPHEVTQSMRADEQIIIVRGHAPLRCGRALYFRRDDMRGLVASNRFQGMGGRKASAGGTAREELRSPTPASAATAVSAGAATAQTDTFGGGWAMGDVILPEAPVGMATAQKAGLLPSL